MRIYLPPSFGQAIRSARKAKGLTQAQLAQSAGVSRRYVAAVEAGANVSIAFLMKLAPALEITDVTIGPLTLHLTKPLDRENG